MITIPQWLTDSNLGSFPQTHSFYLQPVVLNFITDSNNVSLLNGSLPPGIYWYKADNDTKISLFGESDFLENDTTYEFSFRIINLDGLIADRTFFLTITAVIPAPTWNNQPTFLGYQRWGYSTQFTVRADTTTPYPIVYKLPAPAAGQTIDSQTGLLSLPAVIGNQTYGIDITANVKTSSRSIHVTVTVLADSSDPGWITPAGEIASVYPGEFVEYLFQAYTPIGTCTFTFSGTPPTGYTLTSEGLLYGTSPTIPQLQTFVVAATNVNGTSYQTQQIKISNSSNSTIATNTFSFVNNNTDLGSIADGHFYKFNVSAVSPLNNILSYSVTGGWLPNSLTLLPEAGILQGFIDYHVKDHLYQWEISVSDGYSIISQTYSLLVQPSYFDEFATVTMPVTGTLKQKVISQTRSSYPDTNTVVDPKMNIISGLRYHNSIPDLLDPVTPWLHTQNLQLGNLQVYGSNLYRNVIDPQAGADAVGYAPGGSLTIQNLQNIRNAWMQDVGLISSGSGDGASFLAQVDLEHGSINEVIVTNTGSGYYYLPKFQVTGTGTGAQLEARLGIVSATVLDNTAYAWPVNSNISVSLGTYDTVGTLTVNSINSHGYITSVSINNPGLYSEIPRLPKTLTSHGNTVTVSAQWGVIYVFINNSGTGYDNTTQIALSQQEYLPEDQSTWIPEIYLCPAPVSNQQQDIDSVQDEIWKTNSLALEMQGLAWQGATSYDQDQTTWDGGSCTFQTWTQPQDTVWDGGYTTWDKNLTTWDNESSAVGNNWTYLNLDIQDSTTWQQLYQQLYISNVPWTTSETSYKFWLSLTTQQLSNTNAVYFGNVVVN